MAGVYLICAYTHTPIHTHAHVLYAWGKTPLPDGLFGQGSGHRSRRTCIPPKGICAFEITHFARYFGHARSGKSITKRQQNHKTTAGLPVQVFGPRFGPPCCVFSLFSSARCLALFHPLLELLPGAARLPRLNYLFAHVSRCFRSASLSPPKPAESNGARPTPSRCRCHRPGGDTPRARGVSLRTVPCARSRDAGRSGQFLRRSAGRRSCSERSAPVVSSVCPPRLPRSPPRTPPRRQPKAAAHLPPRDKASSRKGRQE